MKIKTKEGEKEVDNGVWRYVTGANNEIAHEESRFDFDTDVLRKLEAACHAAELKIMYSVTIFSISCGSFRCITSSSSMVNIHTVCR